MDYRIKMEPISEKGQEKLSDDLRNGIECKGFTLIANLGDKTQVVIQGMSTHDLAEAFAGEAKFMAAALGGLRGRRRPCVRRRGRQRPRGRRLLWGPPAFQDQRSLILAPLGAVTAGKDRLMQA